MEELLPYRGITLLFNEVTSTLEKDGIVYATMIKAEDRNGCEYILRERSGQPMIDYIGKPMECIIEMITFDFFEPETSQKELPGDIKAGIYVWSQTAYKFIPELLELIEGHEDESDYDYDEEEYDRTAGGYFEKWGVYGIGLDIYQSKPMIETENGVFLLNEYENEEIIDGWKLDQTIHFRPKEMLLRGIKPYEGKWEKKKNSKEEVKLKPGEAYVIGKPRFLEDMR